MKTYEHRDGAGRLVSFEIDNAWVGRQEMTRVIQSVPGARVLPRAEWAAERCDGEFCQAVVGTVSVVVEEPFNDNSRYLISTRQRGPVDELERVHAAFMRHEPKPWFSTTRLVGLGLVGIGALLLLGRILLPMLSSVSTFAVGLVLLGGLLLTVLFFASALGLKGQFRGSESRCDRKNG